MSFTKEKLSMMKVVHTLNSHYLIKLHLISNYQELRQSYQIQYTIVANIFKRLKVDFHQTFYEFVPGQ